MRNEDRFEDAVERSQIEKLVADDDKHGRPSAFREYIDRQAEDRGLNPEHPEAV